MAAGGSTFGQRHKAQTAPPVLAQGHGWVVLNKPAGLASHAGPRGGASAEDWFPQLSRRPDGPWLAHRLDADTAGCLLVALRKSVLIAAQAAFAGGRAGKIYWAVLAGAVTGDQGVIAAPLRKVTLRESWRIEADPRGARAVTHWRVLGRATGLSWVEFRPLTGRTHQIRVHALQLGAPILGDPVYGQAGDGLHLLARSLDLTIEPPMNPPVDPIRASAPPPPAMRPALAACGWSGQPPISAGF